MAEIANHAKEPWPSLESASWWFDRAGFVLIGALVIGAVATGVIVWLGIVKEHHWDLARDRAGSQIAELNVQAEQLRKDTAEANQKAAEAQLALERFRAPRTLTVEQRGAITFKLSSYKEQEFSITPFWDIKESLDLANQIHAALVGAMWTYTPSKGFLLGGIAGVQVWIHPEADEPSKNAANDLVSILNREGVAAILREQASQNPKENKIGINVGTKP